MPSLRPPAALRALATCLLVLGLRALPVAGADPAKHIACDAAGRPVVTFALPGFTAVPSPGGGYGNLKSEDAEVTWRVGSEAGSVEKTRAADRERLEAGRISDFQEWKVPGATAAWSFYDAEDEEAPVWTLHVFAPAGHLHLGVSAFEWKPGDPKGRGRKVLEAIAGSAQAQ